MCNMFYFCFFPYQRRLSPQQPVLSSPSFRYEQSAALRRGARWCAQASACIFRCAPVASSRSVLCIRERSFLLHKKAPTTIMVTSANSCSHYTEYCLTEVLLLSPLPESFSLQPFHPVYPKILPSPCVRTP